MYSITKPTLLLDKQRTIHNIEKMIQQARRGNVHFRPHFKTHQSAVIGDWFRERGITAITTSSVDMALYFAGHTNKVKGVQALTRLYQEMVTRLTAV